MADLEKAKKFLQEGNYTCVLCGDDKVYTSTFRGVKPLVQWLRSDLKGTGFFAADRVVGKATAFLYVLLGVEAVYAHVISRSALNTLQRFGIVAQYETLADHIINRKGDGICPFEATVMEIQDPQSAYIAILEKMQEMSIPLD